MPYRDDFEALQARRAELEHELETIQRSRKDLAGLAQREDEILAELERVTVRGRFASNKRLPLLDRVYVASPCNAKWDEMVGDAHVRFCGHCAKNVYDLSALTRDEAERLVRDREGDLCVRFHRRDDGTMMTNDCPIGLRGKRRRRIAATALAAAAAGGSALAALAGRTALPEHAMAGEVSALGVAASAVPQPPRPPATARDHVRMGIGAVLPRRSKAQGGKVPPPRDAPFDE